MSPTLHTRQKDSSASEAARPLGRAAEAEAAGCHWSLKSAFLFSTNAAIPSFWSSCGEEKHGWTVTFPEARPAHCLPAPPALSRPHPRVLWWDHLKGE